MAVAKGRNLTTPNLIEPSKLTDQPTNDAAGEQKTDSNVAATPDHPNSKPNPSDGWLMFRGNPQSTGVAKNALADELEVLWEFKVKKGAFEGTAAIVAKGDEQIVYIGDLDGTLFSLDLISGRKALGV